MALLVYKELEFLCQRTGPALPPTLTPKLSMTTAYERKQQLEAARAARLLEEEREFREIVDMERREEEERAEEARKAEEARLAKETRLEEERHVEVARLADEWEEKIRRAREDSERERAAEEKKAGGSCVRDGELGACYHCVCRKVTCKRPG